MGLVWSAAGAVVETHRTGKVTLPRSQDDGEQSDRTALSGCAKSRRALQERSADTITAVAP